MECLRSSLIPAITRSVLLTLSTPKPSRAGDSQDTLDDDRDYAELLHPAVVLMVSFRGKEHLASSVSRRRGICVVHPRVEKILFLCSPSRRAIC